MMVKWSSGSTERLIPWKTNLLQIGSVFTASKDNLTTDQINLFEGVRGESTTERLDLS
jgi:hypothetical protein